jgi:hypothetical protein
LTCSGRSRRSETSPRKRPGPANESHPGGRGRARAEQCRKRGQFCELPAAGGRLRGLPTHFVAFMRGHASHPPARTSPTIRHPSVNGHLFLAPRREIAICRVEATSRAVVRELRHFCSTPLYKCGSVRGKGSDARREGSAFPRRCVVADAHASHGSAASPPRRNHPAERGFPEAPEIFDLPTWRSPTPTGLWNITPGDSSRLG